MQELESELSPLLTYHNPKHTLYVLQSCEEIADHEAELSWQELKLLQAAALYHDSGFMRSYKDHEYE
ncbi:HD domain-containing protein, partial [Fulvivirga lutimaris]